jgi:hypothetical protein
MWRVVRERVVVKSPVRENRPPGSVRGAPGNRRPYRDLRAGQGGETGDKSEIRGPIRERNPRPGGPNP